MEAWVETLLEALMEVRKTAEQIHELIATRLDELRKEPNMTEKTIQNQKKSRKAKNPTTNYRMDSHEVFCARCYRMNRRRCPLTGRGITRRCKL